MILIDPPNPLSPLSEWQEFLVRATEYRAIAAEDLRTWDEHVEMAKEAIAEIEKEESESR